MSTTGNRSLRREGDPTDSDYLRQLGDRVREARARRGMTRKILARDSGVSERYLAQLETGQGNASILLLRQIAHAMGMPLVDLVREGPERPIELTLLLHFLSRLPPQKLERARDLLVQEFGPAPESRRNLIALIGLRGGGKSTLGSLAAERLGIPFVELDREIERESGTTLSEIFALYGQAAYRRYERRALESVIARHDRAIITTGGSLVSEPDTFDLLLSACFTVWIKASPEEHMNRVIAQGDYRPMADNAEAMEDLRRILAGRESLYAKADATIDTSGRTVAESLAELLAVIGDMVKSERHPA
ncbi:MAG TPA: helix-turn-helix transcriptional regulator [Alphaproteobacteria bacterium]